MKIKLPLLALISFCTIGPIWAQASENILSYNDDSILGTYKGQCWILEILKQKDKRKYALVQRDNDNKEQCSDYYPAREVRETYLLSYSFSKEKNPVFILDQSKPILRWIMGAAFSAEFIKGDRGKVSLFISAIELGGSVNIKNYRLSKLYSSQ